VVHVHRGGNWQIDLLAQRLQARPAQRPWSTVRRRARLAGHVVSHCASATMGVLQPEARAIVQAREVVAVEPYCLSTPRAARNQSELVALSRLCEQHATQSVLEAEFGTDDEFQCRVVACGDVGPHHAGNRAFIGNRQRRVTELRGTLDQLFRLRGSAQETEIRKTVQFRVSIRLSVPSADDNEIP
jgi:hypothetical protein